MERDPHPPEGGDQPHETETPAEPIFEQLSDEQRIQRGIADALNEERTIDDATARRIAEQLHGEHESLLSTLAASGSGELASMARTSAHSSSTSRVASSQTPCSRLLL